MSGWYYLMFGKNDELACLSIYVWAACSSITSIRQLNPSVDKCLFVIHDYSLKLSRLCEG